MPTDRRKLKCGSCRTLYGRTYPVDCDVFVRVEGDVIITSYLYHCGHYRNVRRVNK